MNYFESSRFFLDLFFNKPIQHRSSDVILFLVGQQQQIVDFGTYKSKYASTPIRGKSYIINSTNAQQHMTPHKDI